jgi:protein-tyrosine-phosphatase
MKVLFVCAQNVGRSQMAAAFYNQMTGTADADSAGTNVDTPGQTLLERAGGVSAADKLLKAMDEEGIDLRAKVRTALQEDMLKQYDLVINMAEPERTPDYLAHYPGCVRWDIVDPRGKDEHTLLEVRDQIKHRVQHLINA